MGAKYNFTISGNSLLMQRTPIIEDTQYKAISFKSPSLVQDNNKIKLFEAGEFQTSLRFIDFGLIDGISSIDLQDAKDKLLVLIGTISEGGGDFVPLSGTTDPITGNIEIRSTNSNEKALILSKVGTVGITENPKFSFGRIVNGGINEPKLRIVFSDDVAYTDEVTCFEVEPSGTAASVRSVIGSHYEGFLEGEEKPLFRIASFLKDGNKSTRMEFGSGGNNETDIFLERWASWAFALVMGGSPKVIFYPDSILRQPGVVDAFQQTPIGQVVATPNPDVKKLFYREGKGLVELGGDGIEKPLVNNNSGNFIPLSGTTAGNPITGDLEVALESKLIFKDLDNNPFIKIGYNPVTDETGIWYDNGVDLPVRFSILSNSVSFFIKNNSIAFSENEGIIGSTDFTPNITDLDYTQKKYVDPSTQRTTQTSGTFTPTDTPSNLIVIHEADPTTSLTINLPTTPRDKQQVTIMSVGGIVGLTIATAVGTIIGTVTTLSALASVKFVWLSSESKWYKI